MEAGSVTIRQVSSRTSRLAAATLFGCLFLYCQCSRPSTAVLDQTSSASTSLAGAEDAPAKDDQSQVLAEPFRAADKAASRSGFEKIIADRAGIDFVHQWAPQPKYAEILDRSFAGGGVAIGDYDGDGLPDVFLTRPFGGCRLYRNLGNFQFENATDLCAARFGSKAGVPALRSRTSTTTRIWTCLFADTIVRIDCS